MRLRKIWDIKEKEVNKELSEVCEGNRILSVLLSNRGINTKEKAIRFLNPLKVSLTSPDVFTDMQKAVERIQLAIDNNQHITVFGDFDADGITSTALLYLTLKQIGADVDFYLPDRANESHGLNTKALVNIISKRKSKLIITVDCGISNVMEVNFANGFRTDVIITDHHEAPAVLPNAFAIINPKAPNSLQPDLSLSDLESLNTLAGVGVAFKVACKLLEIYNKQDFVHEILPLAAVGTIGDIVDLTGENRTIVAMGIELIKRGKNKGLQALLKSTNIEDMTSVTSENITYYVVPRLNAAGRLDNPASALNLLISEDEKEIENNVKLLNDLNSLRQNLCEEAFEQAKEMYEKNISQNKKSIILLSDNWHVGIVGIVASKLVESYNKPAFLMTRDTNNPNIIRCSCRSIQGLNIHSVLSEHKDLFEGFGGHKMAAGFAFDENKIKFENLKNVLNHTIADFSQDIDFNSIKVSADMVLNPEDLTIENINAIEKLQPFGAANPSPVFVMNGLKIKNYRFMGQNNNHLKLFMSKDSSNSIECVKWSTPDFNLPENSEADILFSMGVNEFNGNKSVQLILSDLHSDLMTYDSPVTEIKILDHRKKKNIIMQVLDFITTTKKNTAIYLQNSMLEKSLNLTDEVKKKVFSTDDIPAQIEQLMFFDCPNSKEEFERILKETEAKTVHLMNFNISEINSDNFISKLSGMIKYSIGNINGELELVKLSKALDVDVETVDCALSLLENISMINLDRYSNEKYKVSNFNPTELSKIKHDELYTALSERIDNINSFRKFYLDSTVDELKEELLC